MQIAYFVHAFPSWSETFVSNQISGLRARGHDVEVFAQRRESAGPPLPDDGPKEPPLPVHYRPVVPDNRFLRIVRGVGPLARGLRTNPPAALRALNVRRHGRLAASLELLYSAAALFPRRSFEVVHCHFGPNGILAAALRDIGVLNGPLVTTFHAYDLTKYLEKWGETLYARLFELGDRFLVISERWRARLLELGCPEEKIRVHHMGVDCRRLSAGRKDCDDTQPVRLLSVGRMVEKKGFEYGVRAVAELVRRGLRCEYEIIGDGPLRTELERLIERLDVSTTVRLSGWKTSAEVFARLRASDVLMAPSVTGRDGDQEGIPVTLMEAMAIGLPVVSTRHSGIPELVRDKESGYLVAERDVAGLAERLADLMESPQRRRAMGAAGRSAVERDFDIEKQNDRLVRMFNELRADFQR